MSVTKLQVSRRQRATPYTPRVEALGVSGYSVVNHTILPKGFRRTLTEDYWHLKSHVQLWDVGCQRQVQLQGPDAGWLAQLLTPRDLRNACIGQCLYAPMIDETGGMLNDPIILKLAQDHFWFSIADADILLWARAFALGRGLDVQVDEPDVWPLAVQGPMSDDLLARVFGDKVRNIGFFKFEKCDFQGHDLVVARSGFSRQGGFEIYVDEFSLGTYVWDALWDAGSDLDISPGCPNLIERIEGGLLSYGNEMTRDNNPLECRLEKYCQLGDDLDYIGKPALERIAELGHAREIRGLIFGGEPCHAPQFPWPVTIDNRQVGYVTSATWSPRFEQNVSLAMIERDFWQPGTEVVVKAGDDLDHRGVVTSLPME
jgi:dimethylsulfoniopropionate demethylase